LSRPFSRRSLASGRCAGFSTTSVRGSAGGFSTGFSAASLGAALLLAGFLELVAREARGFLAGFLVSPLSFAEDSFASSDMISTGGC
jgi:hypothetical protein